MTDDLRTRFLARPPKYLEPVTFLGEKLFVRSMGGRGREIWEDHLRKQKTEDTHCLRALMTVLTLCDATGALVYRPADVDAVADGTDWFELQAVFEIGARLSKVTYEAKEQEEKNSSATSGAGSCSGSPDTSTAPSPSCSTPATPPN